MVSLGFRHVDRVREERSLSVRRRDGDGSATQVQESCLRFPNIVGFCLEIDGMVLRWCGFARACVRRWYTSTPVANSLNRWAASSSLWPVSTYREELSFEKRHGWIQDFERAAPCCAAGVGRRGFVLLQWRCVGCHHRGYGRM